MIIRIGVFGVLLAILYLPVAAYGQDFGRPMTSVADINTENTPNDSIVVISKEETGLPGYVHEKYALVDQNCGGTQIVDYYGPAINPNDQDLHKLEQSMCTNFRFDRTDGD